MKKPVVHFEIGCDDIKKTSAFYEDVFGWKLHGQGSSVSIDQGSSGISGHINQLGPGDLQKYITIYIETDTLDSDLKTVESKGGKILVHSTKLPDGRSFAWFEDVAGNPVGLITPDEHEN